MSTWRTVALTGVAGIRVSEDLRETSCTPSRKKSCDGSAHRPPKRECSGHDADQHTKRTARSRADRTGCRLAARDDEVTAGISRREILSAHCGEELSRVDPIVRVLVTRDVHDQELVSRFVVSAQRRKVARCL